MNRPPLAMIAAVARGRVLGHKGQLPWHHPEDLKFFRDFTLGRAILQGRKTYESVGRPLPKRRNLVISRQPGFVAPGCEVFRDVDSALLAARESDECPVVIGGAQIYAALLPQATVVHLTLIDEDHPGDTFFPELPAEQWQLVAARRGTSDAALTFCEYRRVR